MLESALSAATSCGVDSGSGAGSHGSDRNDGGRHYQDSERITSVVIMNRSKEDEKWKIFMGIIEFLETAVDEDGTPGVSRLLNSSFTCKKPLHEGARMKGRQAAPGNYIR